MKTTDVGKRTKYEGYKSFDYLEPGTDYREFKLAKELDRVPSRKVEVSSAQEERVQRVLDEYPAVSLHDHCFVVPVDFADLAEYRRQGRDWTGYAGMAQSGLDAVFDCLMDGTATITSKAGWKWDDIIYDLGMRMGDIAHQDFVIRGESLDDIKRAKENGQIAFIASLEAATAIENEVDRLDILYGLGIRSSGIAYSETNTLGRGLKEARDGGLTEFGRQAVRRMNKLGIAIDISHSGDQTSLDTIQVSDKPIFITHAGARGLWNTKRMKPDEVLKALAAKGGVIGIEAAPHTTLTEKHPLHSLESGMDHVAYCVELMGIDHVGLGPDTLFGDHVGLHRAFAAALSLARIQQGVKYTPVRFVDGMESPAEAMPNAARWLVAHGYKDADVAKILGGNVLRVLKETWAR